MENNKKIAIIGGSGFYSFFQNTDKNKILSVKTPFGDIQCVQGDIEGKNVIFLPRHGSKHSIPPHEINHKANIYALFKLGVTHIISTNAVGSVKVEIKPGEFVILDQFIDLVSGAITFFDGSFQVEIRNQVKNGVIHLDMSQPYDQYLRETIIKTFESYSNEICHPKGCYVMNTGPRFETPAEIRLYQILQGDVVGMTNTPEVVLSKELSMNYATICLVTNFAAGMQAEITHQEVVDLFNKKISTLISILKETIKNLK
ncbi:MAG: MTAP family purine nucleoside phosphorylase [Candidatus Hodarchaeales archaeon]|jgi:5'-methylthioadenosine phosphorylase